MHEVRFDDLPGLQAAISEEFGPWGAELEMTQAIIDEFAELTGDHQWIHVDVERAASGPYGATIAHGLLTLSITPRIRPPFPVDVVGQGSTINYGSEGFRLLEPVRSGDIIHAHSRLAAAEAHAKGTRLVLEIAVHVVGNARPSLVYKAVVLHAPPVSEVAA